MMHCACGWRNLLCEWEFQQQDSTTGELPVKNTDLEERERSPKWEQLILEGDQVQQSKIKKENGEQLSGKRSMDFSPHRQLLRQHLVRSLFPKLQLSLSNTNTNKLIS